ncbi:hypothetical protein EJ02DRAFT_507913, partial [Clathrospora elynae]
MTRDIESGISARPPSYTSFELTDISRPPPARTTFAPSPNVPRPLAPRPRTLRASTSERKKIQWITISSLILLYTTLGVATFVVSNPAVRLFILPLALFFGIPLTLSILTICLHAPNSVMKERPRARMAVRIITVLLYIVGFIVIPVVLQGKNWEEDWVCG